MNIFISRHAIVRYKQRIDKNKNDEQIRGIIRYEIRHAKDIIVSNRVDFHTENLKCNKVIRYLYGSNVYEVVKVGKTLTVQTVMKQRIGKLFGVKG